MGTDRRRLRLGADQHNTGRPDHRSGVGDRPPLLAGVGRQRIERPRLVRPLQHRRAAVNTRADAGPGVGDPIDDPQLVTAGAFEAEETEVDRARRVDARRREDDLVGVGDGHQTRAAPSRLAGAHVHADELRTRALVVDQHHHVVAGEGSGHVGDHERCQRRPPPLDAVGGPDGHQLELPGASGLRRRAVHHVIGRGEELDHCGFGRTPRPAQPSRADVDREHRGREASWARLHHGPCRRWCRPCRVVAAVAARRPHHRDQAGDDRQRTDGDPSSKHRGGLPSCVDPCVDGASRASGRPTRSCAQQQTTVGAPASTGLQPSVRRGPWPSTARTRRRRWRLWP